MLSIRGDEVALACRLPSPYLLVLSLFYLAVSFWSAGVMVCVTASTDNLNTEAVQADLFLLPAK